MRVRIVSFLAALAAVECAGLAAGAAAAEEPAGPAVSEIRLGLLQHDVELLAPNREPGQGLNAEFLFRSPGFLDRLGAPRPHLGGSVSFEGEADHLYAGLTWTFRPFDDGPAAPLWLSAFGGGAVHDGQLTSRDPDEKQLGSRILFRFGAEIGWQLSQRVSVSAYYAHISNAYLASPNEGLDDVGVRLGWRF